MVRAEEDPPSYRHQPHPTREGPAFVSTPTAPYARRTRLRIDTILALREGDPLRYRHHPRPTRERPASVSTPTSAYASRTRLRIDTSLVLREVDPRSNRHQAGLVSTPSQVRIDTKPGPYRYQARSVSIASLVRMETKPGRCRYRAGSVSTPSRVRVDTKPDPCRCQAGWVSIGTSPNPGGNRLMSTPGSSPRRRPRRRRASPRHAPGMLQVLERPRKAVRTAEHRIPACALFPWARGEARVGLDGRHGAAAAPLYLRPLHARRCRVQPGDRV
jgi:hypothetical protein